jgi:GntR family transcriptional regulator
LAVYPFLSGTVAYLSDYNHAIISKGRIIDMIPLPITISEESREPIYYQIEVQIKALIIGKQLKPGDALPSIRSLANDLKCSVITTRRAYQNLENQGYIETVQGKGTFVKRLDEHKQAEAKRSIIAQSFQKVIEQGLKMGCRPEELRRVFEEVLKRKAEGKGVKKENET